MTELFKVFSGQWKYGMGVYDKYFRFSIKKTFFDYVFIPFDSYSAWTEIWSDSKEGSTLKDC